MKASMKGVRITRKRLLQSLSVAVVVIVSAAALGAYLKYRTVYNSIHRVAVTDLGHRPPVYSTSSMNVLVFGSDSRAGLDHHEQVLLHTGNVSGNNTDTIMVIHISPGRHRITAMSIPRDTMVPQYQCDSGPGYPGQQANPNAEVMINSLLAAGGPSCLWKTVEQQTGIHIDHFIELGLSGFAKVINDVGGVNVCVPFNVNDPVSGLQLAEGEHHINGVQALAFWRTREDLGTGSDLERIQRDQFMSAQVVKGVLHSGLLSSPTRLFSVITDAASSLTTDNQMTLSDLLHIGESFRGLSAGNVQFITAPNEPWVDNAARVQFEQPQADAVFSAIAHDVTLPKASKSKSNPNKASQPPVLEANPADVKVSVLNGSGVAGIAGQAASDLTARGFDVTGTGDAASFGYTASVIEYSTAAQMPDVNTLKKQLTSATVKQDTGLTPGTVELIVGSDFTGLTSQGTSPTPSASPSSSPTQSVKSLAKSAGGITASASCTSDASAFAGPNSP